MDCTLRVGLAWCALAGGRATPLSFGVLGDDHLERAAESKAEVLSGE